MHRERDDLDPRENDLDPRENRIGVQTPLSTEAAGVCDQIRQQLDFLFRLPHVLAMDRTARDELSTIVALLMLLEATARRRADELSSSPQADLL